MIVQMLRGLRISRSVPVRTAVTNKTWTIKPTIVNTARPMSPASFVWKCFALAGLLAVSPCPVFAQTNRLVGGDLPLTSGLSGDQVFPSVAIGTAGGFAVWQDNGTDPSGLGIRVLRLDASLNPVGAPVRVNQTMGDDQQRARVALLKNGGAVVVFQSGRSGKQNILLRLLNADGSFLGNEILVNSAFVGVTNRYRTNWTLMRNSRPRKAAAQIREIVKCRQEFNASPSVTVLTDGTIVVAYASSRNYTTNSTTLNTAIHWNGSRFVTNITAVPYTFASANLQDVYLQRFSSTGEKLGEEILVNQFASFNQREPAIAALDNGNFIVTWISERQRTDLEVSVYGRLFDNLGQPLGNEFAVVPLPKITDDVVKLAALNRSCGAPVVTANAAGGFSVAWSQRSGNRTNGTDVLIRAFDAAGVAVGGSAVANEFLYGDQHSPCLVTLGSQQLLVWSSMGQDGSWGGVFGRAFVGAVPVGAEFRINTLTRFDQKQPQVAADNGGRALALWSGFTVDSGFDLFGRFYVVP